MTVVTGAVNVVLAVPNMICADVLAVSPLIDPPAQGAWQGGTQVCTPRIWVIPIKREQHLADSPCPSSSSQAL